LKAGLWFRRGRFVMLSPVHGNLRRRQAEIPLINPVQFSRTTSNLALAAKDGNPATTRAVDPAKLVEPFTVMRQRKDQAN
jgi:hypothetical protein